MEIAIIGSVGIPANYGGFETLVEQIVSRKRSEDIQYTVYCSKKAYKEWPDSFKGAKLKYINLKANGIQSIPYDILSMIHAAKHSDKVLALGVSGCVFLPILRLFSKKKFVINIDGLEHRRKKWNKWIRKFLKFSEAQAVKYGDIIVADNKGIADYVIGEYGVDAELIAYGGDHVIKEIESVNVEEILKEYGLKGNDYAMALCRIEPENNVEMILEAYSKMPSKKLLFIGNWDGSEFGREMKSKYSRFSNISLQSAIYDLNILNVLRNNCSCYIHGHSAGGTNPSLVEAMFYSKPIFAFDCVYNRETTENNALYFKNTQDLIGKIENSSSDLDQIGKKMFQVADIRYRWETIVSQYENLFK